MPAENRTSGDMIICESSQARSSTLHLRAHRSCRTLVPSFSDLNLLVILLAGLRIDPARSCPTGFFRMQFLWRTYEAVGDWFRHDGIGCGL